MKVFWKPVTEKDAKGLLDSNTAEEIQYPADAILEIEQCLRKSALCLPPSARKFRDWDVGLLERYQPKQ